MLCNSREYYFPLFPRFYRIALVFLCEPLAFQREYRTFALNQYLSMNNKLTRILLLCIALTLPVLAEAQVSVKKLRKAVGLKVLYQHYDKGKPRDARHLVWVKDTTAALVAEEPTAESKSKAQIKTFLDYAASEIRNCVILPDGEILSSKHSFRLGAGLSKEVGKGKVLGLNCRIYRTVINSNTIDVWVSRELPFRATPQYYAGIPDGLVLKVVRNGDEVQEAVEINAANHIADEIPTSWGREVQDYELRYALRQSVVKAFSVFEDERVCFDGSRLPRPDSLEAGKVYRCGGGSIVLKKVRLPHSSQGSRIFAELVQYSDGDAYDRTGSIFVVPTNKSQSFLEAIYDLKSVPSFRSGNQDFHGLVSTPAFDVPVELMRFITGFGVRKYNYVKHPKMTWVDSVVYKQDITSLASQLEGDVWVGAYIGNWDKNGHKVSLTLKYHPDGGFSHPKAMPLFNTTNYLEQAGQIYPTFLGNDSLRVRFRLEEKVSKACLYYLTTGHGGWGGGDEFNQKMNTIFLDGRKVIDFIPWRDDCGSYRHLNPCSGDFSNGLSSSDYSRSNWCPATVTNPEYIYLGDLEAGEHEIVVKIPQGAPEGTSQSYWCLSGTLLYY